MEEYNPQKIEKKWQEKWRKEKLYSPNLDNAKKPFYNLMMFPYPSAEGLHVGNMYAFVHSDTYGRYMRMKGYDVFEPIGLDGFGMHSENYAIKIKEPITEVSKRTEKHFYEQLKMIGNQYDWQKNLETYKPQYYKWTQWIFIQMFKKGLAYRAESFVNWCPSCKTVLSDEQVISGKCERCDSQVEKKKMNQWFFKITDYAERLLNNLENLNWSERTKLAQKNWIGKSEGAEVNFEVNGEKVTVFTTRPDTLFGATYFVMAPEHPLVEKITTSEQKKEVDNYIKKASKKTTLERTELEKEKTGVFTGAFAINPANKEKIPVWIADYVMMDYGTGAIMAVPAHDERDLEFAKKYKLPIKQVVALSLEADGKDKPIKTEPKSERKIIIAIIKHWKEDKYICLDWERFGWKSFVIGGIEKDEIGLDAAKREAEEETGYKNFRKIEKIDGEIHSNFNARHKNIGNRYTKAECYLLELENEEQSETLEEHTKNHKFIWLDKKEVAKFLNLPVHEKYWDFYINGEKAEVENGVSINSDFLNGLETKEAKEKMIEWLEKNKLGKKAVNYKLRDWCVSRQRYWGPPIPMIFCENCGWQPVEEKDLPVLLPETDDYLPKGDGLSPLARNENFVNTKCPKCNGKAKRETDVSDVFLDSTWYFFRYPSTEFSDKIFDEKRTKKWLPVDMYIGGHEHAVLHLLYSRFVTMFFKDIGLIDFEEPYKRFFAHGLVICEGAKMSKSKGNVINPDKYIEKYGADAVRMYLMFMGDVRQGGDWRDSGMMGMFRFIKKVWQLFNEDLKEGKGISDLSFLEKTIKKVGEDLEKISFNTAIAKIMECMNWYKENKKEMSKAQRKIFFQKLSLILSPFAPHLAEEFWEGLGNKESIFKQPWPKYDEKLIEEEKVTLIVQVNGKLRDKIEVEKDLSQKEIEALTLEEEKIKKYISGKRIKKIIFVPNKLINIVI